MLDPSVETKTSVLWWDEPEKLSAICSIAAVEAALVDRPAALSDVARRDQRDLPVGLPGQGGDQVAKMDVVPVEGPVEALLGDGGPVDRRELRLDLLRHRVVGGRAGRRVRAAELASCLARGAALAGSKASGGTPPESGDGTHCSENIAITAATGTASSANL